MARRPFACGEELVHHVFAVGAQARHDVGYEKSNPNEMLAWGLRSIATEHGVVLSKAREVQTLIRMALFDMNELTGSVAREILDDVTNGFEETERFAYRGRREPDRPV